MENTTEQSNLKKLYNTVDWIDFGLVIAIILYYSRYELPDITEFDLAQIVNLAIENASLISVGLLLASLVIATTLICFTIKMRRLRLIGVARATARLIWNGIWIPLDIYFLYMILSSRLF